VRRGNQRENPASIRMRNWLGRGWLRALGFGLRPPPYAWSPPLPSQCLASVESDAQVHCSPIEWLQSDRWHDSRVVLIGDAAHASSPMMGQGGCMAIEDALVLAELLSTSDSIEGALDAYVARRRPRMDWVQQQSRIVGQSVMLPSDMRDGVLREGGNDVQAVLRATANVALICQRNS
jgi:2-polyprenyl-6-methoxyphenol hydroxylase-like FAD-dependent oxidoreductase